jgi:hypothetical protein
VTASPRPSGEATQSWFELASEMFPNSRPMTAEEAREFDAATAPLRMDTELTPLPSPSPSQQQDNP